MAHRGVGHPGKEMDALDDDAGYIVSPSTSRGVLELVDTEEQIVELFPHVRADLLAYLPRVFASRHDARGHRVAMRGVEERELHQRLFAVRPGRRKPEAAVETVDGPRSHGG